MKKFSQFDYFLDPILVVDNHLNVIYCNHSCEIFLKISERRILSKNFLSLINFGERINEDIKNFKSIQNRFITWTIPKSSSGSAFISFYPDQDNSQFFIFYLKDQTVEDGLYAQTRVYINQLENYSKELENKVLERTKEVFDLSKNQSALLNSVNQGFLIFDKSGIPIIYSKAFENIFDIKNLNFNVKDILKLDESFFNSWMNALYEEILPFDDIKNLGPNKITIENKTIDLNFFPIKTDDAILESIVLMATDVSDKVYLEKIFNEESMKSKRILSIVKRKSQLSLLINESKNIISELLKNPNNEFLLHTLKGVCSSFHLDNISLYIHDLEDKIKNKKEIEFENIRHLSSLLNNFYIEVEEILGNTKDITISVEDVEKIYSISKTEQNKFDLDNIFKTYSLKAMLEGYSEVVSSLSTSLGKKTQPIEFIGDTRIDKQKNKDIINQLIHIFRNIADHAIETPEERQKNNKNSFGKITIKLKEDEKNHYIEIIDDGKGIDTNKIKEKFNCQELSEEECFYKIFEDNVSTKDQESLVSGRGVGLSSVKKSIEKIGGTIKVSSIVNMGTTFKISIPK